MNHIFRSAALTLVCILSIAAYSKLSYADSVPDEKKVRESLRKGNIAELTKIAEGLEERQKAGDHDAEMLLADIFSGASAPPLATRAKEAVGMYENALRAGKSDAAIRLGDLYSSGRVVPEDLARAFDYFRQAATDPANIQAQRRLADCYAVGKGVAPDIAKAIEILTPLADNGDKYSTRMLADSLTKLATPEASKQAVTYYEKLAEKGDNAAIGILARSYIDGTIIPIDEIKSAQYRRKLLEVGSDADKREAAMKWARAFGSTPAISDSVKILTPLAEGGDSKAALQLGDIYASNNPVFADLNKSRHYYELAAASGDDTASDKFASLLARSPSSPDDITKATEIYKASSAKGNPSAKRSLAKIYLNTSGATRNVKEALALLQELAIQGDSGALLELGDVYAQGRVVPVDVSSAVNYYERSTKAGNETAVVRLADLYLKGRVGRTQDLSRAVAMLSEAAVEGNTSAIRRLIAIYRDGVGKTLKPATQKARLVLATYGKGLDDDHKLLENMLIDASLSRNVAEYDAVYQQLLHLDAKTAKSGIGTITKVNANVYVYIIQKILQHNGGYNGPLDGQLSTATIRAVTTLCLKNGDKRTCNGGPLTSGVTNLVLDELTRQIAPHQIR